MPTLFDPLKVGDLVLPNRIIMTPLTRLGSQLKDAFGGVYIANEKFTYESASDVVERGDADAVAFGRRLFGLSGAQLI